MISDTKRKVDDASDILRAELRRQRSLVEQLCRQLHCELDEIANATGERRLDLIATTQANLTMVAEVQRLQAGATKLVREVFDLHTAARAAVARHAFAASARGVRLRCYVHRDAPRSAVGDKARLRGMLSDLVANMIACCDGGDVSVFVGLETVADKQFAVRFTIRDRADQPATSDSATAPQVRPPAQSPWITPWYASLQDLLRRMGGRFGCWASETDGVAIWLSVPFGSERPRPERAALAALAPVLVVCQDRRRATSIVDALQGCGLVVEVEADHRHMPMRLQQSAYSLVLVDREGGAHGAMYASRPGAGDVRMVPIIDVPLAKDPPGAIDGPGLVRLVQRRITSNPSSKLR